MRRNGPSLSRQSLAVVFCLVTAAAVASAEDRVNFVDDFVMDAVVIGYDPVHERVSLEVDNGTISIPRDRILTVDYDTTISRELSERTDEAVALAKLMEEHEEYVVALDVLEGIRERDDVPGDIDVRMAGLYEKLGRYSEAIEKLRSFLEKHPGDMEIQAEIDRIMAEMRSRGEGESGEAPVIDVLKEQVDEGLEEGGWRVEAWGDPGEIRYISLGRKIDRLLRVSYTKQGKDKVAVRKSLPKELSDLTTNSVCRCDIYNNSTVPVKLALAIVTSPGWVYYESVLEKIPPRQWVQGIEFDLSAATFKSEASGWKHTTAIQNLNSTIQVLFLIYDHPNSGVIFLNNIDFK